MNNSHLYKGIKDIHDRDTGSLRVSMYKCYLDNNTIARYVDCFCNRYKDRSISTVLYLFWFLYNFSTQIIKNKNKSILSTYEYVNEFNSIKSFCNENKIGEISFLTKKRLSIFNIVRLIQYTSFTNAFKSYRLLKVLKKRYNFLVVCRVLEFLSYYFFLEITFRNNKPNVVIFSSDVNPNGVSIIAYSIKYDINSVYIINGLVTRPLPRLNYTLSVLNCPYDAYVYDVKDFSSKSIFIPTGDDTIITRPIPLKELKVGVYLSTFPNIERVISTLQNFEKHGLKIEFIRPHPNELSIKKEDLVLLGQTFSSTKVSNEDSISFELENVDFTIGGNTCAHTDSLKEGRPTVYFGSFDSDPKDLFGFIENKLIPNGDEITTDKLIESINMFYQDKEWSSSAQFYSIFNNVHYEGLETILNKTMK